MNVLRNNVFDFHYARYEKWFIHHQAAYLSELLAVRTLLPIHGLGLEVGVGAVTSTRLRALSIRKRLSLQPQKYVIF